MRELRVEYARQRREGAGALSDKRSLLLHPEEGRRIDELCARIRAQSGVRVTFNDVTRALLSAALDGVTDKTKLRVVSSEGK